jgi:hypothetical protein
MCKLEDLIDKSPLSEIIQSIEREDNDELATLLQKSLQQIIGDKTSFQRKSIEIKNLLRFHDQKDVKELLNQKLVEFGRTMKDVKIPFLDRELHTKELVTELEKFRSNISSIVPELMLAALVHEDCEYFYGV